MTPQRRSTLALCALMLAACTANVSGHGRLAHSSATIPPGPPATGSDTPVPVPPLDEYVDNSGSPRIAISINSTTRRAVWSTVLVPGRELVGAMTMPNAAGGTVTVNTSFSVRAIPDGATATLTVSGWLRAATHEAHIVLHLDQPPDDAVLDTGTPDIAAARSRVSAIVAAVNTADWTTLAGMLAPDVTGGASAAQLATAFSASGISHAAMRTAGNGRLTRLPSGDPAWLQNYTITARDPSGKPLSQHGVLVIIDENRAWWLLSAGT